MAVKIRLSRIGGKNKPYYRIVVKSERNNRDGNSLEILGFYNPLSKEIKVKLERVDYWLSKGAKTTPVIDRLLKIGGKRGSVKSSTVKEKADTNLDNNQKKVTPPEESKPKS